MMVCAELGIAVSDSDFSNNAAYVASWLDVLRGDNRAVIRAASAASKAADYLLAFRPGIDLALANEQDATKGTSEQFGIFAGMGSIFQEIQGNGFDAAVELCGRWV
jgi:antirestriction protein ArdC